MFPSKINRYRIFVLKKYPIGSWVSLLDQRESSRSKERFGQQFVLLERWNDLLQGVAP